MLNQAGRAATKKLKMLDSVVTHLHKLAIILITFPSCIKLKCLLFQAHLATFNEPCFEFQHHCSIHWSS